MHLLGFDRRAASWKYRGDGALEGGGLIDSVSGVIGVKIAVSSAPKTIDGRLSNTVSIKSPDVVFSSGWATDSTGTYLTGCGFSLADFSFTLEFHDTRLGPRYLYFGKKYADTGTFSGTARGTLADDSPLNGTFSGATSASAKLFGHDFIHVRGVDYDAIKGVYSISLNGNLQFVMGGAAVSVPVRITEVQSFWAVTGTGAVRVNDIADLILTPPNDISHQIRATAGLNLVSFFFP
jgi:hypothetical protein